MKAIANTTIVSNFCATRQLDVLRRVVTQVYISTDVYAETQDGLSEGYDFYAGIEAQVYPLAADGWLRLTALQDEGELRLFAELQTTLHRGEASSLAIAARRGWAFLTDDARARRVVRELNVRVSGTLGILVQAVKQGVLSLREADLVLEQMIQAGYQAPYVSLAELV
jgi:predicted nucleic acid-binding protein